MGPMGVVMNGMTRLAAAALALATVCPASAADLGMPLKAPPMIPPPVDIWTGFYIGANGGVAWGRSCWTFTGTIPDLGLPAPVDEGCHDLGSAGVIGGQVGFNWQAGPVVLGLEAQGDWTNLRGENVSLLPSPPFPPTTNESHVDGLGLFTARVGYAWNSTLVYVKGGAAAVHDSADFFGPGTAAVTASTTRWGGTIGAGLEYKFTPNWSAAVEYDFIDLGTSQITFPSQVSANVDINGNVQMFTARLNYIFH
jgi:outer membrane immunogenic protein